ADLHHLTPLYQIVVPAVATEMAVLSNFLLNDNWTFRDRRNRPWPLRLLLFQLVSLLGWLVNNGVIYVVDTRFGLLSDLPAMLAGVAVAFVANFIGNLAFTYRRRDGNPL
ncbi:MAG: GtrA family protein, partial [Thermoplasmatota archaeon]